MSAPSLDIIIVNWNTGEQLASTLDSIAASERAAFMLAQVVVVDNASQDNSLDVVTGGTLPITLIRNETNRGFGFACNQGARASTADYLLFLNPDTRLQPATLQQALAYFSTVPDPPGILGIQLIDPSGHVARSCARNPVPRHFIARSLGLSRKWPHRFPDYIMSDWPHNDTRHVDHVIGAFFLVRRPVFEALQGFDERFFMYLEDLDLCLRARQAGWSITYLADVQAYHKGGGVSEQVKAKRLFYSLQSRLLFCYKHFSWFAATLIALTTLFIEPCIRLGTALARRSPDHIRETLCGYRMLWRALPRLAARRNTNDKSRAKHIDTR